MASEAVRDTKGDRTRRAIITAARERFAAAGFEEATLAEVAAAAGVSGPAVAHHFGSKAGLLTAVVNDYYDELVGRIDEVIAAERSPLDRLVAFAHFWLGTLDGEFLLHAIFSAEGGMRAVRSDTGEALRRNNARVTQRFQRLVEDLKADGTLRDDVDTRLVRDAFFGTAEHVVRGAIRSRRALDHESVADGVLALVLHGAAVPGGVPAGEDRLGVLERKLDEVLARLDG